MGQIVTSLVMATYFGFKRLRSRFFFLSSHLFDLTSLYCLLIFVGCRNVSRHCIVQTPICDMSYIHACGAKLFTFKFEVLCNLVFRQHGWKRPKINSYASCGQPCTKVFYSSYDYIHVHKHHPFIPKSTNWHITVMPQAG